MSKGHAVFTSGMRGNEKANEHRLAATADPGGEGTKALAEISGMRGSETHSAPPEGLQPGSAMAPGAAAGGEGGGPPAVTQHGDYFMVPVHKSQMGRG